MLMLSAAEDLTAPVVVVQLVEEFCGVCAGQGRVEKTKTIKINIPAGKS